MSGRLELKPSQGVVYTEGDRKTLSDALSSMPVICGLLNGSLVMYGQPDVLRNVAEQLAALGMSCKPS
jgi:hypothetical protein